MQLIKVDPAMREQFGPWDKSFGNSERVISGLGPARLNIGQPCGGIVLHEPTKIGHVQRGRRIGKDTFPKASQPYQAFFFSRVVMDTQWGWHWEEEPVATEFCVVLAVSHAKHQKLRSIFQRI